MNLPELRYASTAQIEGLDDRATLHHLNRDFDGIADKLDPHGWHVLTPVMAPTEHPSAEVWVPHYRCWLVYKLPGSGNHGVAMVDVAVADFEQLWTEEALDACFAQIQGTGRTSSARRR